jgi:recombinational DNA repair protein RecT
MDIADSVGLDPRLGFCIVREHQGRDIFILTFRGIARLAMESGEVAHFSAQPVFEKDDFALDLGTNTLKHAPWAGEEGPGALVGAYAQTIDVRGARQIAYLSGRQVYERSNLLHKENMTAQELAKKIAAMELVSDSYLTLPALRVAISAEITTSPGALDVR